MRSAHIQQLGPELLFSAAGVTVIAALVLLPWPQAFGMLAMVLAVLLTAAAVWRRYPQPVVRLVAIGLAVRVGMVIAGFVVALPDSQADALFFERQAFFIAEDGWSAVVDALLGAPFSPGRLENAYSALIAVIYSAFGVRSPLAMQAINVLLGTLTVLNVYRAGALLWGHRAGVRVGWVAALFPALVLYSALTMREATVAYLLTVAAIRMIEWVQTGNGARLVAGIVAGAFASLFHSGAIIVPVTLVVLAAFAPLRQRRGQTGAEARLRRLIALGTLALALFGMFQLGVGLQKLRGSGLDLELIAQQQAIAARGTAAYLPGLQLTSWIDAVWQGPIRAVYFFFSPFPWQIRTSFQAIGWVDSFGYVVLWGAIVRHLRLIVRDPTARNLLALAAALSMVYAIGTSNFGTAIRHRQKFAALLIVLAGAAWARPKRAVAPARRVPAGEPRAAPVALAATRR